MTNVVFVSWNIYPGKTGGIEVFNYHFVRWLAKQDNINPILVTSCSVVDVFKCTKCVLVQSGGKHSGFRAKLFGLLKGIRLAGKSRSIMFLSYSKSNWKDWLCYLTVSLLCRTPYIIYIHGGGLYPWKHFSLMRRVFRNAASIFAVSPKQKTEYEDRAGVNIKVVPPLLPFRRSESDRSMLPSSFGISESSFIFLYLGTLRRIKGTDILIDAFMKLGDFAIKNDLHLLLVGKGDNEQYTTKAQGSTCSENIHFTGVVPYEKVSDYYNISNCFVLPSRIEGMSIALMEALYNKLPSILPQLATIPNVLKTEENCLTFKTEDSTELAAQMKRLVIDTTLFNALQKRGHELCLEHWTGDRTFTELKIAFEQATVTK